MSDDAAPQVPPPRRPGGEPTSFDPRRPDTHDTVAAALGLFVAAAGGAIGLLSLFGGGVGLFACGVAQLLGVVPLLIYAYRKQRPVLAKVTWICAGIVFLLNAACFGVVLLALGNMH